MKAVCIFGSGRYDGNSALIGNRFVETAQSLGAEVTKFELNRLNYRGCQGCMACKTKLEKCVQKDDLTKIFSEIEKADVIMLSAPIYFSEIPGQVKCFVDRTYGYLTPDYRQNPKPSRLTAGRKLLLITTQGAAETRFAEIPQRYIEALTRTLSLGDTKLIRACNVGQGGIPKGVPDTYLQQAEEAARALLV